MNQESHDIKACPQCKEVGRDTHTRLLSFKCFLCGEPAAPVGKDVDPLCSSCIGTINLRFP